VRNKVRMADAGLCRSIGNKYVKLGYVVPNECAEAIEATIEPEE